MNGKTIVRVKKDRENPYVVINKEFLSNDKLSWKAKGLLTYLLSKPDNWKTIVTHLIKQSKDGEKSVYAGLKELQEHKYLLRKKVYINGKISHWENVVFEKPYSAEMQENQLLAENGKEVEMQENQLLAENLQVENLQVENLQVEKEELLNNDYTNYLSSTNKSSSSIQNNDDENNNKTTLSIEDQEYINLYRANFKTKYGAVLSEKLTKDLFYLKGKKVLDYYLENYKKILDSSKKNIETIAGYFYTTVKNEIPLPVGHTAKPDKPIQAINYEQREYDDDYLNSLYDNVTFIKTNEKG